MVASNYGGAYNPAYTPAYSPAGSAPPSIRPLETPNRFHTSNVHLYRDTFVSDAAKSYVDQSWNFNNGARGGSVGSGGGVPSNGYKYKVLSGSSVASHQSRLAAAYAEQAQVDAERQAKLQQAAHNDQLKAQQEQYQTQQAYGGQQYQDNTMQYIGMAVKIASLFF